MKLLSEIANPYALQQKLALQKAASILEASQTTDRRKYEKSLYLNLELKDVEMDENQVGTLLFKCRLPNCDEIMQRKALKHYVDITTSAAIATFAGDNREIKTSGMELYFNSMVKPDVITPSLILRAKVTRFGGKLCYSTCCFTNEESGELIC